MSELWHQGKWVLTSTLKLRDGKLMDENGKSCIPPNLIEKVTDFKSFVKKIYPGIEVYRNTIRMT